jgi:hypothetical protein
MANTAKGVVKDGVVVPSTPLPEGAIVEVHVLEKRGDGRAAVSTNPYPLRGSVVRYDQPTEPVAEADWEALD